MSSHREGSRSRRRSASHRFFFERLEDRTLLAVTTSLSNGDLTITGDAANDDMAIVGTANPGELTITGRNGTLVNGTANGSVTIPGVTRHLIVNLDSGDDRVSLDNTFIAGNIEITTGDGNDRVMTGEFNPVSPAGHLTIDTGNGDDVVQEDTTIYNTFVVGLNTIRTGAGNDSVSLYGASALRSIGVFGGTGNDSILLNGVTSDASISLNGETGANSLAVLFSSASVSLNVLSTYNSNSLAESPRNTYYVDTVFTAILSIETGNLLANDPGGSRETSVTVARSIAFTLGVITGDGVNHVVLRGNTNQGAPRPPATPNPASSQLSIGDRGVNDIVVQYNVFPIWINFTAGQTNLSVVGNIGDYGFFNGGPGPNYLVLSGNRFGRVQVTNFIQ